MKQLFTPAIAAILGITPSIHLANQTQIKCKQEPIEQAKNQAIYQKIQSQLNRQEQINFTKNILINMTQNLQQKNQIVFNPKFFTKESLEQKIYDDFAVNNLDENFVLNVLSIDNSVNSNFIKSHNLQAFQEYIQVKRINVKVYDLNTKQTFYSEWESLLIQHKNAITKIEDWIDSYFMYVTPGWDVKTIFAYPKAMKNISVELYVDSLERMINKFNKYQNIGQPNLLKYYIETKMWNDYVKEVNQEIKPIFTGDSINGWDLIANDYVQYFYQSLLNTIMYKILSNVGQKIMFQGKTVGQTIWNGIKAILWNKRGIALTLKNPYVMLVLSTYLFYQIVKGNFVASWQAGQLSNKKMQDYIKNHKAQIEKLYGFQKAQQFSDFLSGGFNNGFASKWGSLLQKEAIKDRAYLIYDPALNRNWAMDPIVIIESEADLRMWIGVPYHKENYDTAQLKIDEKIFYTAINAVKWPFLTTYHGPISNTYQKNYVLEAGINFITQTKLRIRPKFKKLGISTIKNRFVYETYNSISNLHEIYHDNLSDINDSKIKHHLQEMTSIIRFQKSNILNLHQFSKMKLFQKGIYEIYHHIN